MVSARRVFAIGAGFLGASRDAGRGSGCGRLSALSAIVCGRVSFVRAARGRLSGSATSLALARHPGLVFQEQPKTENIATTVRGSTQAGQESRTLLGDWVVGRFASDYTPQ